MGRATDPSGTRVRSVDAHCSRKHAGQVMALHDGEEGGTLVSGLGKRSMGGFAEGLHGGGAVAPQGFERDRAEFIPGHAGPLSSPGACQRPKELQRGQGCELQNEGMKQREDDEILINFNPCRSRCACMCTSAFSQLWPHNLMCVLHRA
jgi:hypothetical protein